MHIIAESTSDGISETRFTLDGVPGVFWSPAAAGADRPLVLLAHGGGRDKQGPGMVARAHHLVTVHGVAAVAIDAPGHGERERTEQDMRFVAGMRERVAAGEPLGPYLARYNAALATRAIPEWRAVLDAVPPYAGTESAVGFWGESMGTAIGIPLLAQEPRIVAAVLGLAGGESLAESAATVAAPLLFLLQWDDELVPRADGLALFDAFASQEKTLHANPGRHVEVPAFELANAAGFLARHLNAGP